MSYPKNLQYLVSRLAGYSTQLVKIRCNQNDSAKPNDVISFDLPFNSLVHMESIRFCGKFKTTGGTGAALRHSEALVRSIVVEAGGQIISTTGDHLPVLWNIMNDLQAGDKQSIRQVYNLSSEITAAPAAHVPLTPFFVSNLLGFVSSVAPSWIDTSLFPSGSIRISIRLSPDSVLVKNGAAATYELSDLYMLVKVADIQDGLYYQVLSERIKTGAIEIPFQQIYSFNGGDRTQNSSSLLFSLSSQSVDMLIGTVIPKAATISGAAVDGDVKNSSYFVRGCDSNNSAPLVQWKINNAVHPAYGEMDAMGAFSETLNALGLLNDTVGAVNALITTPVLWEQKFFVSVYRLNHPDGDPDSRLLSGLNALGTNGQGEFIYKQTGAGQASNQPMVFVLTTATIKLGAGRSMAITY